MDSKSAKLNFITDASGNVIAAAFADLASDNSGPGTRPATQNTLHELEVPQYFRKFPADQLQRAVQQFVASARRQKARSGPPAPEADITDRTGHGAALVAKIRALLARVSLPVVSVLLTEASIIKADNQPEKASRILAATRFLTDTSSGRTQTLTDIQNQLDAIPELEGEEMAYRSSRFQEDIAQIIQTNLSLGNRVVEVIWTLRESRFQSYAILGPDNEPLYDSFLFFVPARSKSGRLTNMTKE